MIHVWDKAFEDGEELVEHGFTRICGGESDDRHLARLGSELLQVIRSLSTSVPDLPTLFDLEFVLQKV